MSNIRFNIWFKCPMSNIRFNIWFNFKSEVVNFRSFCIVIVTFFNFSIEKLTFYIENMFFQCFYSILIYFYWGSFLSYPGPFLQKSHIYIEPHMFSQCFKCLMSNIRFNIWFKCLMSNIIFNIQFNFKSEVVNFRSFKCLIQIQSFKCLISDSISDSIFQMSNSISNV